MKIKQIVIELLEDDQVKLDGDLILSVETAKRLQEQLDEFFGKTNPFPFTKPDRDFVIGDQPTWIGPTSMPCNPGRAFDVTNIANK